MSNVSPSKDQKKSPDSGFSPIIIIVCVVMVGLLGAGFLFVGKNATPQMQKVETPTTSKSQTQAVPLTPEIAAVLTKKTMLIDELARDSRLLMYVEASGTKNATLTSEQIKELDTRWQESKDNDDFIRPFLTNKLALLLTKFQEDHPEFPEIFVTDWVGLNVGQTNKTSDYYQADEAWWKDSFASGKGLVGHGEIEFDDSAKSESIALYVPIYKDGNAIGVVKAVLALSGIKREL